MDTKYSFWIYRPTPLHHRRSWVSSVASPPQDSIGAVLNLFGLADACPQFIASLLSLPFAQPPPHFMPSRVLKSQAQTWNCMQFATVPLRKTVSKRLRSLLGIATRIRYESSVRSPLETKVVPLPHDLQRSVARLQYSSPVIRVRWIGVTILHWKNCKSPLELPAQASSRG